MKLKFITDKFINERTIMYEYLSNELKMISILFLLLMVASAEKAVNDNDVKEASNLSPNVKADLQNEHIVAKRAWQQLQGGWGKRNFDDDPKNESIEEIQRKLMKIYSDQLLSNKVNDNEIPDDYDTLIDKRAWNQMGTAWGKRDWSQLRSNGWGKRESANWNNMRGLWGKRSPGKDTQEYKW